MIYPRVGHINFLNVLPLTYAYFNGFAEGITLTLSVPSTLNNMLENNLLDVSHVSSIAYAKNSDKLFLLPDVCVRADDEVTSIFLVSKKKIDELNGEKIFLTSKSATSHCLLKMILKKYGVEPNYFIKNLSAENPVPDDAAASLIIGDDALKIYLHKPENLFCYDIGIEWKKLTSHSMVYAVWAVNKNFANEQPEQLRKVYKKIVEGFGFGLKNKSEAINFLTNNNFFTFDEMNIYLDEKIKWDFNKNAIEDLKFFYRSAYEMKLLDFMPELNFVAIDK